MVVDVVEEDMEIVQVLAAEADMEDQGQLTPRLLLQQEMNKPVWLRNFFASLHSSFCDFQIGFW